MPKRSSSLAIITTSTAIFAASICMLLSGCQKKSAAATAMPYDGNVKASNPIAYFRLEALDGSSEVGTATYKSAGGASSSSDCAPIGVPGNKCIALNGKDGWISTTQKGGIGTAGSMMVWVNLAVLPKDAGHILYVAGESEYSNDFDLQFETDGTLRLYTSSGSHVSYAPDPKTLANQWHMIVATMDTSAPANALYWDGQLAASDKAGGKPTKKLAFSMGASTVFGGRYFNGSIDEVALWNRALSASEVAALYKPAK